jgi:hypothetical protein
LLPQYGNKYYLAVELTLQQTAQCADLNHIAPMSKPEFTKHLMSLNFSGNDPDNLYKGVYPFDLVIVDHCMQMYRDAM